MRGFTVDDMKTQFVPTDASTADTGILAGIDVSGSELAISGGGSTVSTNAISLPAAYQQEVAVKATYNGVSVDVPENYYTVAGTKLLVDGGVALGNNVVSEASGPAIKWKDLYDATTAQFTRKNTDDTLKVSVYEIFSNEQNGQETIGTVLTLGATPTTAAAIVKDTVSKKVVISDANPLPMFINLPESVTVCPVNTSLAAISVLKEIETNKNHAGLSYGHGIGVGACTFEDQYGVYYYGTDFIDKFVTYKVSQIVENPDGVAENNFSVTGNDTGNVYINGAERGDTFVLTITVFGMFSKDVTVVVGSDDYAYLNNTVNKYTDTLLPNLNLQRIETLK